MKLQRTTLILLVSAILLGGFVYYSETQGRQKQEAVKTTKQPIFSFKEDQIQSVTIYIDEETLEFERVSGQETSWRMKSPKDTLASNAAVAFLLNLLVDGKSDRSLTVPADQNKLQEYGLDKPLATLKVQLKNQEVHWLTLGKPDFNRSFLYAQADPSPLTPQQLKVLLVPIDFEYAVNRPMSEWQIKQENPESPKPSPTAGSSKQPPATGSSKPSPTAKGPKPSPTANSSKQPSAAQSPKPSPTAQSPKSSPATQSPKPSSATQSPKSSPTANSSKQPSTAQSPNPSPAANSSKQPSAAQTPKSSPTANSSKQPSAAQTPKSSPAAQSPKPSPS